MDSRRSKISLHFPDQGPPYVEFCVIHPPSLRGVINTIDNLHEDGAISFVEFKKLLDEVDKMAYGGVLTNDY